MDYSDVSIILLAGGKGTRVGGAVPKQFIEIQGKPLWVYSLLPLVRSFPKAKIILVFPAPLKSVAQSVSTFFPSLLPEQLSIAEGGETRFHSVQNALPFCTPRSLVFVHDAARCLLSDALVKKLYDQARQHGNAIPFVYARDSVRLSKESDSTTIPMKRNQVMLVQTPQVFDASTLTHSYHVPYQDSFTDDASVVEPHGVALHWVEGEHLNLKMTFAEDISLVRAIFEKGYFSLSPEKNV